MNEFDQLKTLNANVPEPSQQRLAPAFANLTKAIEVEEPNVTKASAKKPKYGIHRPLVRWTMTAPSAPRAHRYPVVQPESASVAANQLVTTKRSKSSSIPTRAPTWVSAALPAMVR